MKQKQYLLSLGLPRCGSNYIYDSIETDFEKSHWMFYQPTHILKGWRIFKDDIKIEDIFSFAIVRNPFDLLVSIYRFLHQYDNVMSASENRESFKEWLRETIFTPRNGYPNKYFLFFSMFGEDSLSPINYIGRLETIDEDLEKVAQLNHREYKPGKPSNKSKRKPYQEYYDEESYGWVEKTYHRELTLFGYDREGITHPMVSGHYEDGLPLWYAHNADKLRIKTNV